MADDRPQDQGRRHRKRGDPSAATEALTARWYATLRRELERLVAELERRQAPGLLESSALQPLAIPLDDPKRDRYIARGVTIARELGAEIDTTPVGSASPRRRGPVRADMG